MQTGLKSHVIPFPYYSPLLAVGTLGFSCPPPLSPVSKTFQMDVYAPVSLSPSWQMYYFAEFLALQHHKWLWNWLLSLVNLHHQCRQQERCAWLEEHVCVRKLLQSLRESTDTGFWCDACKHLKRDFRKAGYSCLQITGLWSSEFSSFSEGDIRFQSSICIWNSPITLFHVFISHLIAPHQHKTPNLLQLFSLPKCHWISAICFSFSDICCMTGTTESSLAVFSFLIPRLASLQRIRDRWRATKTTARLTFRDGPMQISHNNPVVLDGSCLWSHSLI